MLILQSSLAILTAVVAWQAVCVAMMVVHHYFTAPLMLSAYTALFGNVQASYGWYSRIAAYVGVIVTTSPATLVGLRLFDVLSRRSPAPKQIVVAFWLWQMVVFTVLICSYEAGGSYKINQAVWALFGPPADLYNVANFVLPRIIAWLLCTIPVSWFALWRYSKLTKSCNQGFPVELAV